MIRTRRPLLLLIAAICAWGLVLACSGGDDSSPTNTAGNSATTSGHATATSAQSTGLAEAGPELSAYHLLDAAGYAAALGEPVSAVEDDGVVPDQYGCEIGQARALTAAGVMITTTLSTLGDSDAAKQEYTSLQNFGSTPRTLSVGDQSAVVDSLALVQKGAQVLRVVSQIAPGVDPKAGGADPTAALAAAAAAAGKAAPALAAKLSGEACAGAALGIPAGGVDPCQMSASTFGDAVGLPDATAQPVLSDEPPFQECMYSAAGIGPVYTYVATHALLEASLYPTTAQELFTSQQTQKLNAQERGFGEYGTFSEPPFQAFGNVQSPGVGIDSTILYEPDTSSAMRLVPGPAHPVLQVTESVDSVLLRILESSSGLTITSLDQCDKMMTGFLDDVLGSDPANGPPAKVAQQYEDAKKALIDYCNKAVKGIDLSQ